MSTSPDDPYTRIERMSLEESVPLRAMLELTYRCNFRCVMCYLVEFRSPGELTTAEYRGVMDQLADMGCLVLTLSGGEPMLRKDFFELAGYAREKRFALRIFTNGSLIDGEAADRFADLKPLSTDVSLYGMSEETYRKVTGRPGSPEKVLRAIRLLRDRNLAVKVKVPVLRENYPDLDRIEAFAREVGARLEANPHITPRDDGDFSPLAHALGDEELLEYYRQHVAPRAPRSLRPEGFMCNSGRNALVISPLGDVFPCMQIKESVGNVRRRPIREIWSGSPLLSRLRTLRVRDFPGCGGCSGKNKTQCAGIARAASGSFTGGDPLARRLEGFRELAMQTR